MKITVYDHHFNANEWFVLITVSVGLLLVLIVPKRFAVKESLVYLLFGFFSGKFFDHTISIKPFDFYDVNDQSSFQLMDFISYIMYAPFGYFFIYIYDKFQSSKWFFLPYILIWSTIAIFIEYFATRLGVYHYKNGYHIYFGVPIYMLNQTILLWIYHRIRLKNAHFITR